MKEPAVLWLVLWLFWKFWEPTSEWVYTLVYKRWVSIHRLRTALLWVLPWHQFTCWSPNAYYMYPFLLMVFHLTKTGSGLNFGDALYPLLIWGRVIGRVFFARHISRGQKWWQTLLEREISCSQWEGPSMHSRCLAFFLFQLGVGEGFL